MWFPLHLFLLIIGFYLGIKDFQKGDKKKLFIWPVIFFLTSVIYPGLFPIGFIPWLGKGTAEVERTFFVFSQPAFWIGFFFILFSIFITSAALYFQKGRYLLIAIGISFLILFIFLLRCMFLLLIELI